MNIEGGYSVTFSHKESVYTLTWGETTTYTKDGIKISPIKLPLRVRNELGALASAIRLEGASGEFKSVWGNHYKWIDDPESDYAICRTQNGTCRFYLDEDHITTKDVPKEVRGRLEVLMYGWSDLVPIPADQILNMNHSNDAEYTFKDFKTSIQYYKDGIRIPLRCVPPWERENMRNATNDFRRYWNEYTSHNHESHTTYDDPADSDISDDEVIRTIIDAMRLLERLDIKSKKDWKVWMLRNHPDKNPNADELLVKLVNTAVSMVF